MFNDCTEFSNNNFSAYTRYIQLKCTKMSTITVRERRNISAIQCTLLDTETRDEAFKSESKKRPRAM